MISAQCGRPSKRPRREGTGGARAGRSRGKCVGGLPARRLQGELLSEVSVGPPVDEPSTLRKFSHLSARRCLWIRMLSRGGVKRAAMSSLRSKRSMNTPSVITTGPAHVGGVLRGHASDHKMYVALGVSQGCTAAAKDHHAHGCGVTMGLIGM